MHKLFLGLIGLAISFGVHAQGVDTLKKIRDSKTITLGYRTDSPPFLFTGPEGQAAGYSVDLCKRFVASLEETMKGATLNTKWVALTAANRFDQVANGAVDLECGNTSATLSRMERFDFSNLIFLDTGAVLMLAEAKVGRLSDFSGKTIGVVGNTTTEVSLKAALKERLIDAKVVVVKDDAEALAAIQARKLDGFAADRVKLVALASRQPEVKFHLIQEDFAIETYALMMRRDPAFRLAVNRALSQLYRTGAIVGIYDRWLAPLGKPGPLLTAMFILNATPE
jgi:ABC-type amino acid transport substrate-binding protein